MAIETYLIEDSEKMIAEPEHLEEWNQLVEELNLDGQKTLKDGDKSPIPFPMMTTGERRVYEVLCPNKTEVKEYHNNTIPLRVLSLIALSQRENYFNEIQIWDDTAKPDPIAVGIVGDKWSGKHYIIARWGDELRAFAELKQLALVRWVEDNKAKLNEIIEGAKLHLATIDSLAVKHFNGEWISI
jgi:hypothetical protein